ncbi:hypothetical protein GJU39_20520 [Pedobacter petrophilus]|uniref:RNA polymerase sigma factor 70 region 4 type 2 domain-containing protein n=1 Tax=Pedobacter petrophilus TaxID=1908241 RepID=A0A7K0G3T2_9SPHI|nr:sigma factor-like helix-turn-helix DNA-binding protein [Pedobacter petrophilus]MRX78467.1 hypothetical protein [Pedobacter petrophilus]
MVYQLKVFPKYPVIPILEPKYRVPFVKYFEGHKYEEIVREMNIPIGTV